MFVQLPTLAFIEGPSRASPAARNGPCPTLALLKALGVVGFGVECRNGLPWLWLSLKQAHDPATVGRRSRPYPGFSARAFVEA